MLSRWFQRRSEPSGSAGYIPEPPPAPHINLIESQRCRAIIDICVAGSARYQSTIREVDPANGMMIIDEVFPVELAASPGQALAITLRWNSRRESFVGWFAGQRGSGADRGYLVKLPPSVGYAERRTAFRVHLPPRSVRAEFTCGGYRYEAYVADVSASGIRLHSDAAVLLRCGDELEEIRFGMLGQSFQCQAEVRNVNYTLSGTTVGAKLLGLQPLQQRSLTRTIMQLERHQARGNMQTV